MRRARLLAVKSDTHKLEDLTLLQLVLVADVVICATAEKHDTAPFVIVVIDVVAERVHRHRFRIVKVHTRIAYSFC